MDSIVSVTLKYDSSKFSQEGRAGFDLLQQKARMTRAIIEGKTNGEEWPSKGFFSSIGDFFSGLKNAIFGEDSPPEI